MMQEINREHVRSLIHLLRHRSLWPKDFVWDYRDRHSCAMGLARDVCLVSFPHDSPNSGTMAEYLGIDGWFALEIFCHMHHQCHGLERLLFWRQGMMKYVTPDEIADVLEKLL